jgi:hypothetical protein
MFLSIETYRIYKKLSRRNSIFSKSFSPESSRHIEKARIPTISQEKEIKECFLWKKGCY